MLNTAFGEPTIAVDTHIFRVANRTGLAPGKDVRAVEDSLLQAWCRPNYLQDAHHWLILHGRYVCKARKPDCPHCAIRDLCRFRDKTPDDPTTRCASAHRGHGCAKDSVVTITKDSRPSLRGILSNPPQGLIP